MVEPSRLLAQRLCFSAYLGFAPLHATPGAPRPSVSLTTGKVAEAVVALADAVRAICMAESQATPWPAVTDSLNRKSELT